MNSDCQDGSHISLMSKSCRSNTLKINRYTGALILSEVLGCFLERNGGSKSLLYYILTDILEGRFVKKSNECLRQSQKKGCSCLVE